MTGDAQEREGGNKQTLTKKVKVARGKVNSHFQKMEKHEKREKEPEMPFNAL